MTVKCTFCNDTKQEPGTPGPCVWCECAPENQGNNVVQRHTIAHLRYAGGAEHNVKYVSEVDYDRVVAERDALLARPAEQIDGLRWRADGEANFYTLLRENNWVATVHLNGEMLVSQHEAILNSFISVTNGEVERLRTVIEQQKNLIASLRAELVESRSIDASAEPSAPVELDERAAYDAWRHSESGYARPFDRHEWSAWQARAALERKP